MSDDIVTQPEQEIDFVEYLRLWASPDSNDQAVRALHKAADEIERLRETSEQLSIELSRHEHQSLPCKGTVDCECGISKAQHVWGFGQAVRGE